MHRRCLAGATEQTEAVAFARADGRIQWVRWEGRPWRDDTGNIGGIVISTEDFTTRKQAEASADHLAAIIASTYEAIISTDLNSVITTWNEGATRLLGYDADEFVGKHIDLIVPAEHLSEEVGAARQLHSTSGIALRETTKIAKDGRVFDVELTLSPIKNALGAIYGMSHFLRDISARKRAETALRGSEAALRQSPASAASRRRRGTADLRRVRRRHGADSCSGKLRTCDGLSASKFVWRGRYEQSAFPASGTCRGGRSSSNRGGGEGVFYWKSEEEN